jgi:outer membrane protein assembly factor BamD
MFLRLRKFGYLAVVVLLLFASCSDFNKVLKSTDYEFKFKKAIEYYEAGEYVRSGTLFQELLNIFRGTSRADQVYYYYAKSMMGQRDYLMATQYFRILLREQPLSQFAEEAQFMVGYASYLQSPKVRLDQEVTVNAIDALQLYINLYPFSERVDEAHRLIDELRDKLVHKSFLNARLYYDFENYKAAVVALENSLKEYPDSRFREELMYMLLRSRYLLAVNSVISLQQPRLSAALDEYFAFVDEFPESRYRREVDRFYETISGMLNYDEQSTSSN